MKKFNPLNVSSKFAICGLPLRLDTYSQCQHDCTYCFSNHRQIGKKPKNKQPNIQWLKNKLRKVYDDKNINKENFLETLLNDRITLHGGTMNDCFQPIEKTQQNTEKIVELLNIYEQHILFSTKTDKTYDVPLTPELHSFQLSISNLKNFMEEKVPRIDKRIQFYNQLKDKGYKVGIRIQPYIPKITDVEQILNVFCDADHYTIESLKLNPHTKEANNEILHEANLKRDDYKQQGLLTLKPEIRHQQYQNIIPLFEENGYSWSIADNDMHWMGNNLCCCGDKLINKQTFFHNTRMLKLYGNEYSLQCISDNIKGYENCKCSTLFTSDRREGCKTVKEFYNKRFDRKTSPFSPKYQYYV